MLYQAIGGFSGCRELAAAFYARVKQSPVLRPLFPGKSMHCATEELTAFLVELLDSPGPDSQRRWWVSLRESHARFRLGPTERDEWLRLMFQTIDEAKLDAPAKAALREFFERSSAYIVNVPPADTAEIALAGPWRRQLMLDQAVAAIRRSDSARAIELTQQLEPSRQTGLIAEMIRSGNPELLDYARQVAPSFLSRRFAGRTLLHIAAARGVLPIVETLLEAGADPNSGGEHTPLYDAANQSGTAEVVLALIRAGANVNSSEGAKRCTPLHMAARRGNVEVAKTLLDSGAAVNARDSRGVTPLGRARNCRKPEVAAVLAARGATD